MYKSKVIQVFSSLSNDERKALQKFAHSPIYNQHNDVIALIDYLINLKQITEQNVDRKVIHKKIYANKPFKESDIRHISSYLYKVMESFIVYLDNQVSEDKKYSSLIKYYRNKGLTNLLDSTINKYNKMECSPKNGADYFLDKYNLLNEIALFDEQSNRTKDLNFEDLLFHLDRFYIIEKLQQVSNMLSHQSVFGKNYDFTFIEGLLAYTKEEGILETPAIAIHYYNYYMVKEPEQEDHFNQYMEILTKHADAFEEEELKGLYILGINYNLRKANKGDTKYPKRVFELYQLGLKNKALLPKGILSPVTYKNIINTALYLNEKVWALKFIGEYKDSLDEAIREDMYNYNLAHYYSRIDDYENALRILATVDLKDENYNSRGKVLQLKMHYELEEYDVLESLLDSFWIYLKRKKHLGYRRDLWLKLIRYIRSIIHTKAGDHKRLKKILDNIQEEKDLMEKQWLIEKIEYLLSRR